jgi:hypothetical protein
MINERKLRGGPGRTGKTQPRRPMSAKHNPMRSMRSVTGSNSKPLYAGEIRNYCIVLLKFTGVLPIL